MPRRLYDQGQSWTDLFVFITLFDQLKKIQRLNLLPRNQRWCLLILLLICTELNELTWLVLGLLEIGIDELLS